MKKFELVFIPMTGMGHLVSMVEMANVLVTRDHRLTVTMLLMKLPFDPKANEYIQSLYESSTNGSIRFIVLPELPTPEERKDFILKLVLESYKPHVKEAVATLNISPNSPQLVGFVLDMFCTTMTDVAKQFEVPCYVFYTSSAGYLAFTFHLEQLYNQNNSKEVVEQLKNSDVDFAIPSFANPVSSKLIPGMFFNNKAAVWLHEQAKILRSEVKGILINTFEEMESHVINALSSDSSSQVPSLYPVGPVLQLKNIHVAGSCQTSLDRADILKWLDDQAPSSVLFLCFGSRGSFDKDQVEKIAQALERSGVRFVWSLRQPKPKDEFGATNDCTNMNDILPEGFLDRTTDVGRVIGWAPQVEILEHPATGGFISHCGWNSTLESLWHGVPIATWPLYGEQQFNAFEMVVELELAVEITIEYRKEHKEDKPRIVSTEEIQSGIRMLMDSNNEIRKKVIAKSEESRKSIMEGGSSFISLRKFIDDVLAQSLEGGD